MESVIATLLGYLPAVSGLNLPLIAALIVSAVGFVTIRRMFSRSTRPNRRSPAAVVVPPYEPDLVHDPKPDPKDTFADNLPPPRSKPDRSPVAHALEKVPFVARPLMAWGQYCLLRDVESFLARIGAGHRLFCRLHLDEVFGADTNEVSDELAKAVSRALEPCVIDFTILDRHGSPVMGILVDEDDPVVHAVFRKSAVPLIVLPHDYSWPALEHQLELQLVPGGTLLRAAS